MRNFLFLSVKPTSGSQLARCCEPHSQYERLREAHHYNELAWPRMQGMRSVRAYYFPHKRQNPCLRKQTGVSEFNLDDDLLSHGETPHYHRRCIVSLLSSGWDQVVPTLYGRQEIRVLSRGQLASLQQIGYVIAFGVL